MELHGKVFLITGAKGGLGTFVTNSFLEAGAHVIGVSRSISDADFPREGFSAIPAEISSSENGRRIIEAVIATAGRIDGLIHLMGGFTGGRPVADTDES